MSVMKNITTRNASRIAAPALLPFADLRRKVVNTPRQVFFDASVTNDTALTVALYAPSSKVLVRTFLPAREHLIHLPVAELLQLPKETHLTVTSTLLTAPQDTAMLLRSVPHLMTSIPCELSPLHLVAEATSGFFGVNDVERFEALERFRASLAHSRQAGEMPPTVAVEPAVQARRLHDAFTATWPAVWSDACVHTLNGSTSSTPPS